MKTSIIYTILGLLAIHSLCAQVKIGDNPQNLDPTSILELQSTNRVLVITRVTDEQMNAISPLNGAIVYNTDDGCINYYNGTEWINICEELDNSFTVSTRDDYLSQLYTNTLDSTVVITTTENGDGSANYNFEVGEINGRNIRNFSIEPNHIVNGAITNGKVASRAINPQVHFFDGATNTRQVILWNGTNWVYALESDLQISEKQDLTNVVANGSSAGNSVISDVLDPVAAQDAATKNYVDTEIAASNQTIVSADTPNSITTGTDGGALYDDTAIQTAVADNATDITANTTAIGLKEDSANKSTDIALGTSNDLFPTQNAVKTYVDNEIATSNQTIVSADTPNSITAGTDGGALYDDTAIQTAVADNAADITANTTAIGLKEDSVNKSTDVALGTSNDLFPTQNAVKTYVDNEIATSNQTIVSADTPNSITAGTDGGALYDDTAIQTAVANNAADITANTTAIGLKEDSANKSTDVALGTSNDLFPTQNAVKTYVDNVTDEIALTGQVVSASPTNTGPGQYTISDPSITTTSIIQLTVQENNPGSPIMIQLVGQSAGAFSVQIYEFSGATPTASNANWQYIVVNP